MKIIAVHNYYGRESPSGENIVFDNFSAGLQLNDIKLETFTTESAKLRRLGFFGEFLGALMLVFNPFIYIKFKKLVKEVKPDLIHIHNTFPVISLGILYAINSSIPVVLTLHNFRMLCPQGNLLRKGKLCTICVETQNWFAAIKNKCYRSSALKTIPMVLNILIHRYLRTLVRRVDKIIVLTDFQHQTFIKAGFLNEQLYLLPNPAEIPSSDARLAKRDNMVVFVGRLSEEKGIDKLVPVWSEITKENQNFPNLVLLGDGPLFQFLKKKYGSSKIVFEGQVDKIRVTKMLSSAVCGILPSTGAEGHPLVLNEAWSVETPVIVSDVGALPSLISPETKDLVVSINDKDLLKKQLLKLFDQEWKFRDLGKLSKLYMSEHYSINIHFEKLLNLYAKLIKSKN
jgi:glycosyltransferase involved in cell wall biosynthesis